MRLQPCSFADQDLQVLKALGRRWEEAANLSLQEENNLKQRRLPRLRRDIQENLNWLRRRGQDLEQDLKDLIRQPCHG